MKLYDCTSAPSPRRVRIFLSEKGLSIPVVQVDLAQGEHLAEPFRRINPQCEVPVLELDDGTVITETVAICRYIEEIYPEPPLLGTSAREKAIIAMWDHKAEVEGLFAIAEAFRNRAKGFKGRSLTGTESYAQIPDLAERGRRRAHNFFITINRRLGESPYLGGERFSVADITAFIAVDFAGWIKLPIPEDHVHLKRWQDEVAARPSARA